MAELNFNALARPGPRGFMQGFEQGQEQQMTEDINRTNLETGRFKLDELKRDRAEMMQLQDKLKGMGQDPDLDKLMETMTEEEARAAAAKAAGGAGAGEGGGVVARGVRANSAAGKSARSKLAQRVGHPPHLECARFLKVFAFKVQLCPRPGI